MVPHLTVFSPACSTFILFLGDISSGIYDHMYTLPYFFRIYLQESRTTYTLISYFFGTYLRESRITCTLISYFFGIYLQESRIRSRYIHYIYIQ